MIRRAAPLFLAGLLLLSAGAGQAQAAGYRYWSFWERDGATWTYATQGPSLVRPADGDVQGFRFAVSEDSADAAKPRGTADFATVCARTPAREGSKRVALVIDFGTPADAPPGETPPSRRTACAQVPPDATTSEALASVAAPLRYDTNALLCAITGYPGKGCGEQIERIPTEPAPSPADEREESGSGPSLGLAAGIAVVALLGAAAFWQTRRRA